MAKTMDDPYRLARFVEAQNPVYGQVLAELRRGRKTSHWMWFIFPQIQGLGSSETARYYAISGRTEAAAYLEHPILGLRLRECTELVLAVEGRKIEEIFGWPDDLKFKSSMTLFANASQHNEIFLASLDKYFAGRQDSETLDRI